MDTYTARTLRIVVCTFVLLVVNANQSHAETLQRIRTESKFLESVLSDAGSRSPTLRALALRIDGSNVIAYVTCEHFSSRLLAGRTALGHANGEARYVRVQVDCMLPRLTLVAIIGHELQHVAEIAAAPDVVDAKSFARLFQTIGYLTCQGWSAPEKLETDGALEAGERVREEYLRRWPVGARIVANAGGRVPLQ
jgi:hypothetical protein